MSVKKRLKDFIKSQGLTISGFEKDINVSNGYVNSISKGIGGEVLLSILEKSPNLNIDWLLTGKGSMLKEPEKSVIQNLNGDDNIMIGNNNSGQVANKNNSESQIIKDLQTEIIRLKNLLEEKEKQLTEKEKQISKLIDKLTK